MSRAGRTLHDSPGSERRPAELGATLSEVLMVVAIIGILSVVVIGEIEGAQERARLSACMANLVTIRETVWANCDGGLDFPEREKLWNDIWAGAGPRGYWYALDNDDPNKGHGNDLDGYDEQNPGKSKRVDSNIYFVVSCEHDHGTLADFVYVEDDSKVQICKVGEKRPRWYKFYRKDTKGG